MSIEYYTFGTPHPAVDIEDFKTCIATNLETESWMRKVESAKFILIHNPRISNMLMTDIDLLLMVIIENKQDNFLSIDRKIKNPQHNKTYLYNMTFPIKFIDEEISWAGKGEIFSSYQKENRYDYNVGAFVENTDPKQEYFFKEELKDLGIESKKYLEKILGYEKINTHPIIWILTNQDKDFNFWESNILRAPKFGFRELYYYLACHPDKNLFLKSIEEWAIPNDSQSFNKINQDIARILSELEKDSYTGSLTLNKIKRITEQYHNDLKIYEKYLSEKSKEGTQISDLFTLEETPGNTKKLHISKRIEAEKSLDNNIVIINGKAGSGKTSELYLLMKKCYENKKEIRFLTYNKLLKNDAQLISNIIRIKSPNSNKISIMTIHQFIYRISKNLGIATIINAERVNELLKTLTKRATAIQNFWDYHFSNNNVVKAYSDVPFNKLDIGSNRLLRKFLNKNSPKNNKDFFSIKNFSKQFNDFINYEKEEIARLEEKEGFLRDYYNILEKIYEALFLRKEETSKEAERIINFYQSADPDTWNRIIENRNKGTKDNQRKTYIQEKKYIQEMVNRSLGQFSRQMLFVDEGQDCHELERDIFLKMFENKNIVVATGGREQLIRFGEECRWNTTRNHKIAHINIDKRNTSFRMKENIIKLCNFIADKFEIDLKLTSTEHKDKGNVIISTKKNNYKLRQLYDQIHNSGEYSKHSRYENILFLLDTDSKYYLKPARSHATTSIDQYSNIKKNKHKSNIFFLHEILDIDQKNIWLHNMAFADSDNNREDEDDENNESANPDQHRAIYYESCRGLEAWAVMCFDIDLFYDRKKEEEDAALFCSDDLFMTEDERRAKYAATQVLMALTRAIDTLYIEISNPNSELGKIIMEYIDIHKEFSIDNHVQDFHDEQENKDFYDDDIPF